MSPEPVPEPILEPDEATSPPISRLKNIKVGQDGVQMIDLGTTPIETRDVNGGDRCLQQLRSSHRGHEPMPEPGHAASTPVTSLKNMKIGQNGVQMILWDGPMEARDVNGGDRSLQLIGTSSRQHPTAVISDDQLPSSAQSPKKLSQVVGFGNNGRDQRLGTDNVERGRRDTGGN